MPSLNPMRLRGVAWVVLVEDVRPNPSCDHRTATSPIPIRIRLRTAWTATCGSFAQAWIAMSPPVRAGSRASPTKGGRSHEHRRAAARARPNRSSNRPGPYPMVTVSCDAGSPNASPVSSGGPCEAPPSKPPGTVSSPRVIRAAASVQRSSSSRSATRSVVSDVQRHEVHPVLSGGDDAGLVGTVERDDLRGR